MVLLLVNFFLLSRRQRGAFGFNWLGKLYFIGCMTVSWGLSSYFGWFDAESRFRPLILYSIRLLGLALLSQSASSRELSMCFVFVGCMIPYISESLFYFRYSFIVMESFRQRRRNSRNVTESELQRVARIKTQNELAKLRVLLRNNPIIVQRTNDRFYEGEKTRQMDLLNRFVAGSYSGLPSSHNREDDDCLDDYQERTSFFVYILYASLLIMVVVLIKFYRTYLVQFASLNPSM